MNRNDMRAAIAITLGWTAVASGQTSVVVRPAEGAPLMGTLERFDLNTGLVLALPGGGHWSLAAQDLVWVRPTVTPEATPGPTRVLLADGGQVTGQLRGDGGDHIAIEAPFRRTINIPLDRVRACVTATVNGSHRQHEVARIIGADRIEDQVLLTNGDRISGFLDRITPEMVVFERGEELLEIGIERVAAVVLGSDAVAEPQGLSARVFFADGSVLHTPDFRWDAGGVDLTGFDGTWEDIGVTHIARVEIRGGRWQWLSERPIDFEETVALLGLDWPVQTDRNVLGCPMQIGNTHYDRGIGVHSQSVVRYALGGEFRLFSATAALDAAAGDLADVRAAVAVDGVIRWAVDHIRAASAPNQIHVDLTGAQTLELRVEFGGNGDLQDYFDWADAAVIR